MKLQFDRFEDSTILIETNYPSIMSTNGNWNLRVVVKDKELDFKTVIDDAFIKMEYIKTKIQELRKKK